MSLRPQFELLADCPHCLIDGAVVELYDPVEPASVFGLPAESRCRLCERRTQGRVTPGPETPSTQLKYRGNGHCPGCDHPLSQDELDAHACSMCGTRAKADVLDEGQDLRDPNVFLAALQRFASEEQSDDLDGFVADNFEGLTLREVIAKVVAGERVATGFDAMFALFHRGGRGGGGVGAGTRSSPRPSAQRLSDERRYDPRAMVLALVSVLVADGKEDPREIAFLNRFLAAEGMKPLEPGERKVHRPMELVGKIPPERRVGLVEAMTQLACIDGVVDPSEMRLVASYASAWGVEPDAVDHWVAQYKVQYANDVQRFFRRLRAFFLAPPTEPGTT